VLQKQASMLCCISCHIAAGCCHHKTGMYPIYENAKTAAFVQGLGTLNGGNALVLGECVVSPAGPVAVDASTAHDHTPPTPVWR